VQYLAKLFLISLLERFDESRPKVKFGRPGEVRQAENRLKLHTNAQIWKILTPLLAAHYYSAAPAKQRKGGRKSTSTATRTTTPGAPREVRICGLKSIGSNVAI
jgi:hypothetical protein